LKKLLSVFLAIFMIFPSFAIFAYGENGEATTVNTESTDNIREVTDSNQDETVKFTPAKENYNWDRLRGQNVTLNVFNWGEYMSLGQDGAMHVNREFEKLTGIKVNYQTFANNEEMYTKLVSGGASYDVVIPSDYMIGKMIREDMLQPIDYSLVPNIKYLDRQYLNLDYDPGNVYSIPYTWGYVGIIYNRDYVDKPVDSWDILWDEDYRGDIIMFGNSRDAFAIALARNGLSINPTTYEEIDTAKKDLMRQKDLVNPVYLNDEVFDKMEGGEAAIAPYYAGDAVTMLENNPSLSFAVPKENLNYFTDAFCILKNAQNPIAANMYINFLNEPEVALANAEYIGYATPNSAAYELLDEETKNNPVTYPDKTIFNHTEVFVPLSDDIGSYMDKAWSDVRAYSTSGSSMMVLEIIAFSILGTIVIMWVREKNKKHRKIDY
jgi:spermidine/putrescine transport system substrate-binding protein